jgi:hypothetical protein
MVCQYCLKNVSMQNDPSKMININRIKANFQYYQPKKNKNFWAEIHQALLPEFVLSRKIGKVYEKVSNVGESHPRGQNPVQFKVTIK